MNRDSLLFVVALVPLCVHGQSIQRALSLRDALYTRSRDESRCKGEQKRISGAFRNPQRNLFAGYFVIIYTVITIISHTATRIAMVLVMCASSMGVTTMLTYCTMSRSSECCCTSEQRGAATDRSETPSVDYMNVDCNILIVAGGVNPVALNVSGDTPVKTLSPDLIHVAPGIVPLPVVSHQRIPAHANDIAPPGGDLCIRHRALLI